MKSVMVLIVLLWAGTGWAEMKACTGTAFDFSDNGKCESLRDSVPPGISSSTFSYSPTGCYASFGSPPHSVEVECQEPQGLPVPVCLTKMEAAMRAMDQYAAVEYLLALGVLDRVQIRYTEKSSRDIKAAYAQWDAVKQECWRKDAR